MESFNVRAMRKKYGVGDTRNTYTEEQIMELVQRKLYQIVAYRDQGTGNLTIEYAYLYGYISEDKEPCIFVKDSILRDVVHHTYRPLKKISHCNKVKEGIYHDEVDGEIYCTSDEIEFCLVYLKEFEKHRLEDQIKEMEQTILRLKKAETVVKEVFSVEQ